MTDNKHSKAGLARAQSLTPEERKRIASDAAKARWSGERPVKAPKSPKVVDHELLAIKFTTTERAELKRRQLAGGFKSEADAVRAWLSGGDEESSSTPSPTPRGLTTVRQPSRAKAAPRPPAGRLLGVDPVTNQPIYETFVNRLKGKPAK